MAKQPKKRPGARLDMNEVAFRGLQELTGQLPKTPDPDAGKDPLAVELGRRGGLKGGKARAISLTAKKRSDIAKKAAKERWGKKDRPKR